MKIALTGHTKGIGLAIFDELCKRHHQVIGYSKSNGFDISLAGIRQQVLNESKDFDVFINNAYFAQAQFDLLKDFANLWKGTKKTIINIGSKSVYANVVHESMKTYVADKKMQYDFINQNRLKARPHIVNFNIGLVDTDMSKDFIAEKIQPTVLAKFIVDVIEIQPQIYVQDIMIDVPYQDWQDISFKNN